MTDEMRADGLRCNAELDRFLADHRPQFPPGPIMPAEYDPETWRIYMAARAVHETVCKKAWGDVWGAHRSEIDAINIRHGFVRSPFGGWMYPQEAA